MKKFVPVLSIVVLSSSLNVFADGELHVDGTTTLARVSGNVGIGVDNPTAKLQVKTSERGHLLTVGTGRIVEGPNHFNTGFFRGTDDGSVALTVVRNDVGDVMMGGGQDGDSFRRVIVTAGGEFMWGPGNATRDVTLKRISEGALQLTATSGNAELDVQGDIEYTGTMTDVSDGCLKENIHPVSKALQKIEGLHGVYYNMVDHPDRVEVGLLAQDVQKVVPEAVRVVDMEEGHLGVSYPSLIPVLVEGIKELKTQNEALIAETELLTDRLNALEENR